MAIKFPQSERPSGLRGGSDTWDQPQASVILDADFFPIGPPTVILNSPADASSGSDTTPDLTFTGTSAKGFDITYQVQVDAVESFDSQGTATLSDNFDDNSLDGAKWSTFNSGGATIAESGQKIIATPVVSTISLADVGSVSTYDFTGKSVSVEVVQVAAGATVDTILRLSKDASNRVSIEKWGDGNLYARKTVAGSASTIASISYNATTMRWWRMRQSAGAVQFDYSADGVTWTSWTATTNPFSLSVVYFDLIASEWAADATAGAAWFDNFYFGTEVPLVDKLTASDIGFSGSPDSTDPFVSGQAVTYTVQSALSSGSYYWRVRGKDPSGSNSYGSWTTPWMFTISSGGISYFQTLSDTVTHTDSTLRQSTKIIANTFTLSDSIAKLSQKTRTETVTSTDSVIRQVARTLADSLSISDTITAVKTYLKTLVDSVTHSDSLLKQGQKMLVETITNADSFIKHVSRTFVESVTSSDTITAVRTYLKALADTVTSTDALVRQSQKRLSEAAILADSVVKATQRTIANSISVSDVLAAVKTYLKSLTETVTSTATLSKQTQKPLTDNVSTADSLTRQTVKVILNTLTVADVLQAVKTYLKLLAETITHADTLRKQTGKNPAETLISADTVQKMTHKTHTEAIALTDAILRRIPRVLVEGFSFTDNLVRTVGKRLVETTSLIGSFIMGVVTVALVDPYCQAVSSITRLISPFTSRSNSSTPQTKPYSDGTPVQERPPKDC